MPAPSSSSRLSEASDNAEFVTEDGQVFGSLLEMKAAEARRSLSAPTEATPLAAALAVGCADHGVRSGQPCYRLGDSGRGVCSSRINRALGVAQLRRQREAREAERKAREAKAQKWTRGLR